jgi:Aspartyl/Asparaginyl beta-hydroxylase
MIANPDLWNTVPDRTSPLDSPHYALSDIYVRYSAKDPRDMEEHVSDWYPAASKLPVMEYIGPLMSSLGPCQLGGVLITKIPAGQRVNPHRDTGWHAKNYEKFALQIAAAPGQCFCFDDEILVTKTGDLFWFDNSYTHWVMNDSKLDRITMIICIKRGS